MKREKLEELALEKSNPCVTISMNTHMTHPDNAEDVIVFRKLLKEAQVRVSGEFPGAEKLLGRIADLEGKIDFNHNLNSLHIFMSDLTEEIVKSGWPTVNNFVHIADRFSIRPLIKLINRTEEYLILSLSKANAKLYRALDGSISQEIANEDFPFTKDVMNGSHRDRLLEAKQEDNLLREYLNRIDKALVRAHNNTGLKCVVISTEDNFGHLQKVADKPSVYIGHVSINTKESANHNLSAAAWNTVKEFQKHQRQEAIHEMREAAGKGKVVTGLAEIFKAVMEGRGDLLISNDGFTQPVKMTGEFSFVRVKDVTEPEAVDDITSDIAWNVLSKKGRVIFTEQNEMDSLGGIALKVRY